jgi:hypothetical protein
MPLNRKPPLVAQTKKTVSQQGVKQPIVPPVYRPHAKSVQQKPVPSSQPRTHPVAPPVYRPLTKAAQPKIAGRRSVAKPELTTAAHRAAIQMTKRATYNKAKGRTVRVWVCIRSGWDMGGWMGQHKYFWWEDGTFTGFGTTTHENGPSKDQHEVYWVTTNTEERLKNKARLKKEAFEHPTTFSAGVYMPLFNDCHNLVDDSIRECGLPPTSLGRFSGESEGCVVQ